MRVDWALHRLMDKLTGRRRGAGRVSYSQCGEDLIARYVFDVLRIPVPSYLDIGAHDAHYLNNTYIYYAAGGRGVNIEPDPELAAKIRQARPRDANLNIGIGEKEGLMEFFVMSTKTLNTFDAAEAHAVEKAGKVRIERVMQVPVRPVNAVLAEHFAEASPDFVSLDVEGLDLAILRSLDFDRWRPKVLCVETITYSEQREGRKIPQIAELLLERGYFAFADTYINTIFVDRQIW